LFGVASNPGWKRHWRHDLATEFEEHVAMAPLIVGQQTQVPGLAADLHQPAHGLLE
jgi:hypothetical protein